MLLLSSSFSQKKRTSQTATSIIRKIKFPKKTLLIFHCCLPACSAAGVHIVREAKFLNWNLIFKVFLAAIVFHYKILNNLSLLCVLLLLLMIVHTSDVDYDSPPSSWMSLHDQYRIYEHTRMILKRLAWDIKPQQEEVDGTKSTLKQLYFLSGSSKMEIK